MPRHLFRVATLGIVIGAAATAALAQAPRMGACGQIVAACRQAGFARGGAQAGNGIQVDCIRPIMQGRPQRRRATKPLPQVAPDMVAACTAANPSFGQRAAAAARSTPPSQAPLPEPPAPPAEPTAPGAAAIPN